MVFSSIIFLFLFFPITLGIYFLVPKNMKNLILLVASIFFYAWGEPVYVVLMIFSAVFNYIMGLDISVRENSPKLKRASVAFAIIVNLFILSFFKYYGFFMDNINEIFNVSIAYTKLPLPIGISFYTFQALSYVIDVYRNKIAVQKSLLKFSLYLTMFPQLIAGPIVKYVDIEKQLDERHVTLVEFGSGCEIFIKGLAKKVLLANTLGLIYTNISALSNDESTIITAWIGIIAYTLQIYFDFSGYSDMAIGLGRMFGFEFMKNFNYPYISKSVTEFWRRWHISLSTWFKEYVYIPLGGNRVSKSMHIRNILTVWFLTGFWHGASWNFIVWGLYYGGFLLLEKYFVAKILAKVPTIVQSLYTLIVVAVGWVFFSQPDLYAAMNYLNLMFSFKNGLINSISLYYLKTSIIIIVLGILIARPNVNILFERLKSSRPLVAILILMVIFMLCIASLVYDTYNPFLYFRF
ncbi:MAG: MBOAT family O-acyltransferase [Anaerovoracaceae bacterium]